MVVQDPVVAVVMDGGAVNMPVSAQRNIKINVVPYDMYQPIK